MDKTVSLTNDVDDDGAYDPGDTLEYTITVTNTGSQNTTNVEITDTLPASLTLDSSNASQGNYNGTTWTVGTLNVGDSATLTITAAINSGTEGADITNTAEVSNSDVVDNNTANNSASITITVGTDDVVDDGGDGGDDGAAAPVINVFDPAISKVGFLQPGEVGVTGETLDWSITVTNQGDAAGENVVITDTLIDALAPENVTTTKGTTNISGQTVTVNIGTLNPGETVNITITTTVLEGVQVDNTACLTANGVDQLCTQAGAGVVSALPATGETPWWRSWVVAALSLLGIGVAAGVVVKRRAPHAQH